MTRSLVFLLLCTLSFACGNSAEAVNYAQVVSYQEQPSEPSLAGIQDRISNTFAQAMVSQNLDAMEALGDDLKSLYKKKDQNIIQYWRAYLQFYMAIFHIQSGDKSASEAAVDQGIAWMKDMKQKNSEDYALLAMLQGFSIQFKGMRAMFISGAIKKNVETALTIDDENIRAYYVAGNNDYYTPEQYGGGKKVEEYLLKAIALPTQKTPNEYLPSWGKEEAYELLIKHYIKKEKMEAARAHFKDANKLFPNSYQINQLAAKLI